MCYDSKHNPSGGRKMMLTRSAIIIIRIAIISGAALRFAET